MKFVVNKNEVNKFNKGTDKSIALPVKSYIILINVINVVTSHKKRNIAERRNDTRV